MPEAITENTLFYGDNLPILREHIPDASVDLIYLDPPFNSNRTYNVLFKDESGADSEAQIAAFEDTWHWNRAAESTYDDLVINGPLHVGKMITALREFIGANQMMAYLVMMTARLVELHRVLKPTGSLYLHCDPTASHYLKIILDTIFGGENFRNEFIWKRSSAHSDAKQGAKQAGRIHDVILFYTKSGQWTWNTVYTEYSEEYVERSYRYTDRKTGRRFRVDNLTAAKPGGDTSYEWRVKRRINDEPDWQTDFDEEYKNPKPGWEYKGVPPYKGRYWAYSRENMIEFAKQDKIYYSHSGMPNYKRYLDEMPGVPIQDIWDDIPAIASTSKERLGYPTQKPLALLERIIEASSNPGDWVLDPFCGCGTAVAAAQKLGRRWIGIDITFLSISLQRSRLQEMFPGVSFRVLGQPESVAAARYLAHHDRFQFEWWALSLVGARPSQPTAAKTGKKGADRGVDGVINFMDDTSGAVKRVLVQVKSGKVSVRDVRDLRGTLEREKAALGLLLTLEAPTEPMETEAIEAGFYHSPGWNQKYPRVQILTIEALLGGAKPQMPPAWGTFKQAERVAEPGAVQGKLGL